MTKAELIAQLKNKRHEIADLRRRVMDSNNLNELRELNQQIDKALAERDAIEDQIGDLETRQAGPITESQIIQTYGVQPVGELRTVASFNLGNGSTNTNLRSDNNMNKELFEQRGQTLRSGQSVEIPINELQIQTRSLTIAEDSLVVSKYASNVLNPAFNQVSSLVDLVNSPQLAGGEAYKKGYVISDGSADYTNEGTDYFESDPVFGYAETGKTKITTYCEVHEEVLRLSNVDYQSEVVRSIRNALRAKLSREIIIGAGGSGKLIGIASSAAPADTVVDKNMAAADLDNIFLDELIFSFGGNESVEGGLLLVLTKEDLGALAQVRTTDDKRVYKIVFDLDSGNMGTLSAMDSTPIRFCINSALKPLSAAETIAGDVCMVLCKPAGYEMPIFSSLTVERSTDYKFKQGMIAYKGVIWAGGTPAAYKNFLRIKKAA